MPPNQPTSTSVRRRVYSQAMGASPYRRRFKRIIKPLEDVIRFRVELERRRQHEHAIEAAVSQRLKVHSHGSLTELDDAMAHVVNYATGFRGFYAQAGMWFNPPLAVMLEPGGARLDLVNERIVELPFAMAALGSVPPAARILEIGSAESTFSLSAASLGFRITAVDPRPLPYTHPNLESFAGPLEQLAPPVEPFAAAFLISTIEHVGLGAYGEDAYGDGQPGAAADRALLHRVRELLSPDGLLVLSTPYGPVGVSEFERTYDDAALTKLLAGWRITERQLVVRRDPLTWEAVDHAGPQDRGVVMVRATPWPA